MRSREDVEAVLALAREDHGAGEIARRTGIPRATVRDWLAGSVPHGALRERTREPPRDLAAYSQLLGLYLGDGHVARIGRTFMLRLFFDARYPGLIGEAVRVVRRVSPERRVGVARARPTNCVVLRCYWGQWPVLLPQHGPGRKHLRPIELATWQREITTAHPRELIRGLINSDGCRGLNVVRHGERRYAYPRYSFSNRSDDIRAIFCEHLDLLGIAWRPVGPWQISIARREAVAELDAFVGPKS
jgi:intein/homing endonuclease